MCRKLYLVAFIILMCHQIAGAVQAPVKMSVFNFQPLNIDAAAVSTSLTNMLITSLMGEPSLNILDRKELEAFLSLNDLQQSDIMDNIVNIGTRLGLNAITVGTVGKKGTILIINAKVINIEQKKIVFSQQIRSLGDSRLNSEIEALAKCITTSVINMSTKPEDRAAFKGPINLQTRPGNKRIQLSWENAPNTSASAYEVFRSTSENGPFACIGQTTRPEYPDQNLDNKIVYYYKIKAYNEKGLPSEYSDLVSAETSLTPNPPVILKTDSHIKSIQLTWTPNPISSGDPLKLKGYKLYRSKTEAGPFKEVANILGKDLDVGIDTATTLDRLFKVTFTDKGLSDGESYYYKLTAYNEKNLESELSSTIKGSTAASVANIAAQGDMIREIRLSWTPVESPEIKGYYVYRSEKEDTAFKRIAKLDQLASGDKRINHRDIEGLGDLVRYYYRITAFESPELETSPSATVSAQTKGKPPTPQGVNAKGGLVKKIELSWVAAVSDEVEGYKIYSSRSSDGEFILLTKIDGRNINRYFDEGRDFSKLENNATYYYRLTSFNKVNVESQSVLVSATTKPRPSKPQDIKGEAMKVKSIPLAWTANAETDITCYHIYRTDADGSEFNRIAKVNGKTFYLDKDLKDGAAYRYKIQAEDRDELLSDFSDLIVVKTKPKPRVPAKLIGSVREGKTQLRWEPNEEDDISHYTVYEKRFLGAEKINTLQETRFTEPAPPRGKSKSYVVTATNKDGLESEPTGEITVTGR